MRKLILSRYPSRPKDYVENWEVLAEILVVMLGLDRMMDPVKLRIVKNERQGAQLHLGVHVNQLLGEEKKGHELQNLRRNLEHHCDTGQKRSDNCSLYPIMTSARSRIHRLGAVMQRMHGP